MFRFVQDKVRGGVETEGDIQHYKKEAEEWENKVKKNKGVVKKLEKKREQCEREL